MKNQISKLGKVLSKNDQRNIEGGFGCYAQFLECSSNRDCPPCSGGCGMTIDVNGEPLFIPDLCAF